MDAQATKLAVDMAWSRSLPDSVLPVYTYAELDEYVTAIASGHLNLLIILGPAGVGESRRQHSRVAGSALPLNFVYSR